jgi:iron complex transport system ATP-binding protein
VISVSDVTKVYGNTRVLGPVNLDIPAGGITALVGPNGAGKSTLLTIIGRLVEPTSGRVTVAGLDVARTPNRKLATVLSILRQENHFVTRLTVRELVGFGRFPHSRGRLTAADHEHVDQAIRFMELEDLQHRFLDQLSGGQRQRAYVAMVLAQDTDYILLDEPLNNLDIRHAVSMMKQLRQAADLFGKTFLVVLHDINAAAAYADRIVALTDGEVAYMGTPQEIMCPEVLGRVFDTPFTVSQHGNAPVAICY